MNKYLLVFITIVIKCAALYAAERDTDLISGETSFYPSTEIPTTKDNKTWLGTVFDGKIKINATERDIVKPKQLEIIALLDLSGSMKEPMVELDKKQAKIKYLLDKTKELNFKQFDFYSFDKVDEFSSRLEVVQYGIVHLNSILVKSKIPFNLQLYSFNDSAEKHYCDDNNIKNTLKEMRADGGTNPGAGFNLVLKDIPSNRQIPYNILFITDGDPDDPQQFTKLRKLRDTLGPRINIYVIGISYEHDERILDIGHQGVRVRHFSEIKTEIEKAYQWFSTPVAFNLRVSYPGKNIKQLDSVSKINLGDVSFYDKEFSQLYFLKEIYKNPHEQSVIITYDIRPMGPSRKICVSLRDAGEDFSLSKVLHDRIVKYRNQVQNTRSHGIYQQIIKKFASWPDTPETEMLINDFIKDVLTPRLMKYSKRFEPTIEINNNSVRKKDFFKDPKKFI